MICKRCGQCCFYIDINGNKKKCRYLVITGALSSCRIYKNRLYKEIDKTIYCIERKDDDRIFKECPYNKSTLKPISRIESQHPSQE